MRRLACTLLPITLVTLLAACGDSSTADDDDDDDDDVADAGGVDADGEGFSTLISSDWTIPDGMEIYQCQRLTVDHDIYITSFRAVTPLGSHHSVLTVGEPDGPDGATDCDAGTNKPGMIYGAGIDTNDIALPEGVAMKVPAGQQLLLNLHLYNVSDEAIEGTSAVEIIEMNAADVVEEAEVVLMGRTVLMVVPEGLSTQLGRCTMNGAVTLFMVNPHMHKLGVHMTVVAERGAEELTLHDGDYTFTEQKIYPIDPVSMAQGDKVRIECSYDNDTGASVPFGDSSDDEMCFATTYRYPKFGASINIVCDDGPQVP